MHLQTVLVLEVSPNEVIRSVSNVLNLVTSFQIVGKATGTVVKDY